MSTLTSNEFTHAGSWECDAMLATVIEADRTLLQVADEHDGQFLVFTVKEAQSFRDWLNRVLPAHETGAVQGWQQWHERVRQWLEERRDELSSDARNSLLRILSERPTLETRPVDCKDCEQLIGERDRAQDALQNTHVALGGDGEWVGGRIDPAPDSGDLHLDVPELAALIKQERDAAYKVLGWCLECGCRRDLCQNAWVDQRKCCPDCTHLRPAQKASE